MPTFAGTVTALAAMQDNAVVSFDHSSTQYVLNYNHPGYSSVYMMLIASAGNQSLVNVAYVTDNTNANIIQGAELTW